MTRLFLVRHGETEWSRSGQHTSVTDLPLTEKGEEQSRSLLGHLEPAAFGLVLSSPRQRARRSAELAGFVDAYAPEIDENLAEWSYGDYEGLTREQIQETDPDWSIWSGPTPGGETAAEVSARVTKVIERVMAAQVEQAICFAHGHSLRALAMCWLDLELTRGASFELDTATISVLSDEKDGRGLESWNARPAG
jgi:broad specificity phosphatase PhoE